MGQGGSVRIDEGKCIAYTLLHIEKHRRINGDILGARSSRANKVFCSGSKEKFVCPQQAVVKVAGSQMTGEDFSLLDALKLDSRREVMW